MIDFAERVLSYSADLDQESFVADERTYDATLRNLELIGEAATHIPNDVRAAHPEISWHAVIGTRNRLAHGYLSISNSVIWSIIRDAVPGLLPALRNLVIETRNDHA